MNTDTVTFEDIVYHGAGLDWRIQSEKDKDWTHEELMAGDTSMVVWKNKKISEVKRYSPRNQWSSLSCVANGGAIELEAAELRETGNVVQFSHKDIYIRRFNRPYGGMAMYDVLNLIRAGAAFESQVPSNGLGETEINQDYVVTPAIIETRNKYGSAATFEIKQPTVDKVAQVIEMGIPVILFWYFKDSEWWRDYPVVRMSVDLYGNDTSRHQAIGVDYGIENGEKGIWVQDSAGVGTGQGEYKDLRFVSEKFFVLRNYAAGYAIDKKNLDYVQDTKPRYNFTRDLTVGSTGLDVQALQKILVYENCMQIKNPTQLFAGMTRAGVKALQEKYADKILKPVGLKKGTGYMGSSTRKWLKENYSLA